MEGKRLGRKPNARRFTCSIDLSSLEAGCPQESKVKLRVFMNGKLRSTYSDEDEQKKKESS